MKENHYLLKKTYQKNANIGEEQGTRLRVRLESGSGRGSCTPEATSVTKWAEGGALIQQQGQKQTCLLACAKVNVSGLKRDVIETFKPSRMCFISCKGEHLQSFPTPTTRRITWAVSSNDDLGTLQDSPMSRVAHIYKFMRTLASFQSTASFEDKDLVNGPFVLNGNRGSNAENSSSTSDGKWIVSDSLC